RRSGRWPGARASTTWPWSTRTGAPSPSSAAARTGSGGRWWTRASACSPARPPGARAAAKDLNEETDDMPTATAERPGLDPIENASRDEIQALQLERLRWTLAHAYENVPHYRRAFDAAGVHPSDLR